ncbi:MAG TPA: hypothetical protein VHM70_33055 [Polyangiaceae bacterium]|nr:hypothetical protein [Polyangiaceae bacterium]
MRRLSHWGLVVALAAVSVLTTALVQADVGPNCSCKLEGHSSRSALAAGLGLAGVIFVFAERARRQRSL